MTAISFIIARTLRGLAKRGRPFTGLLYVGLMVTSKGPRVVEFNCRFGDPETQALMPLLSIQPRILDLMLAVATEQPMGAGSNQPESQEIEAANKQLHTDTIGRMTVCEIELVGACVTTVLAAANYPESPRTGDRITLPEPEDGVFVFHAGTARNADGQLVTAGGRVLAVSALGETVKIAQRRSLEYAKRIEFAGKQFRTDIGWREITRQQQASARAT